MEAVQVHVDKVIARLTRSDAKLPVLKRRDQIIDIAVALVLALVGARYARSSADVVFGPKGPEYVTSGLLTAGGWNGFALAVSCAALPLAWRRRFPLAVLWVVMIASALLRRDSPDVVFYACTICSVAVYSAAAYSSRRVATIASLPVAAGVLVALFKHANLPVLPHKYVALLVMIPLIGAAYGFRAWVRRVDDTHAHLCEVEARQMLALQHAVAQERARIARELHDVVTHNVSMMVIQAGAARTVLDSSPDDARGALVAVEAGGRAALAELRHVMGLLTPNTGDDTPGGDGALAPQPGLDNVAALVRSVRDAGVAAELTVHGPSSALPSGVDLAAYRVVQEALTNTMKHAVGARVHVTIDQSPFDVSVSVTDSGGRPSPTAATGTGRGLIGLRERLAVYGGTLQNGPSLNGGYLVHATIPVDNT
jgi:signal transduction histidine kinase